MKLLQHLIDSESNADASCASVMDATCPQNFCLRAIVKQLLIASWFVLIMIYNKYEMNRQLFIGDSANVSIDKVYSELFHGSARAIIRSLESGLARAVGSETDRLPQTWWTETSYIANKNTHAHTHILFDGSVAPNCDRVNARFRRFRWRWMAGRWFIQI